MWARSHQMKESTKTANWPKIGVAQPFSGMDKVELTVAAQKRRGAAAEGEVMTSRRAETLLGSIYAPHRALLSDSSHQRLAGAGDGGQAPRLHRASGWRWRSDRL